MRWYESFQAMLPIKAFLFQLEGTVTVSEERQTPAVQRQTVIWELQARAKDQVPKEEEAVHHIRRRNSNSKTRGICTP